MRGDLIIVGALSFFERLFGDERAQVCFKIFFQALAIDHDATLWRDRHSYSRDCGLSAPDCCYKLSCHNIYALTIKFFIRGLRSLLRGIMPSTVFFTTSAMPFF